MEILPLLGDIDNFDAGNRAKNDRLLRRTSSQRHVVLSEDSCYNLTCVKSFKKGLKSLFKGLDASCFGFQYVTTLLSDYLLILNC
jgi:hypothetical protein